MFRFRVNDWPGTDRQTDVQAQAHKQASTSTFIDICEYNRNQVEKTKKMMIYAKRLSEHYALRGT